MDRKLRMILEWTRQDGGMAMIAWGFFLAIEDNLDPVDRQYFKNIHNQRMNGGSA